MKVAKFLYKCRLCGETFDGEQTNEKTAFMVLIYTTIGGPRPPGVIGPQPEMITTHSGCENGMGVADLIGYTVEEE